MKMRRTLIILSVVAALSLPTFGAEDVIDADLRVVLDAADPAERIPVIAHFADRVPAGLFRHGERASRRRAMIEAFKDKAERTQAPHRRTLERWGVEDSVQLWLINAIAFEAPAAKVRAAGHWQGVERISHDRPIPGPGARVDATEARRSPQAQVAILATPEWNIDATGAPSLWSLGYDGTGVVVATLDSGVSPGHQDLDPRYRGGSNSWFDPYAEHATPTDLTGHGTNTMGVIVGGSAGGTAVGMAPGAQWIAAKIFDDSDVSTPSAIHQAFAWVLDPDSDSGTDDGADVVNNSWGLLDRLNECVTDFQTDFQALKAAGVAVVVSSGNSGPLGSTSMSPANYPEATGVGAIDDLYGIAAFSGRGPSACGLGLYPELVAPGVDIWTTDRTFGGVFPDLYIAAAGTSVAAPHVAGAFALLRQAFPQATVEQLETALHDSAYDLGAAGPDNNYGHGLIDLSAAYTLLASSGCSDADGDGLMAEGGDCGPQDCDDGNNQIWATPGEATSLAFDNNHWSLSWFAPAQPGATAAALRHDVLRSDAPFDFTTTATCVESDDGADTMATDTATPSARQIFYYLIRSENACPTGVGSLGRDSMGAERTGQQCP
jgi:serine protease AprX